MENSVDWIIHLCTDGVCGECGKRSDDYIQYTCNAHTHGMEQYGHMDFQIVIRLPVQEIARILNTLAEMVRSGKRFSDNDLVPGLYDDCSIRLQTFKETGRNALRAMIPDNENRFPEDALCDDCYKLQLLETEELIKGGKKYVDKNLSD